MKNKKEKSKSKIPFNVFRKGFIGTMLGVSMLVGGATLMSGCEQNPGSTNFDEVTWLAGTEIPATNLGVAGDFYYDTDSYTIYQKGEEGWILVSNIKPAVLINQEGYWVIDGVTTEVKATSTAISISENGYWVIDGEETEYLAEPEDGYTPYIEGDFWYINGQKKGKAIGSDGANGKSAYELAKVGGFVGTEAEWIESLKGKDGKDGKDGLTPKIDPTTKTWWIGTTDTKVPATGEPGKSAYELSGFDGSLADWLESLKGKDGKDGESAYQIALRLDSTIGSEAEWLASLKGSQGETGSIWLTGEGEPTQTARVNDYYLDTKTGDVYVKTSVEWSKVSNIKGLKGDQGLKGDKGDKGDAGKDALTIKSFKKVIDTTSNKWGMEYYFELTMSNDSVVNTEKSIEILDNHYYTATETGDIEKLLDLGVKYIRLGDNVSISEGSTFNYIKSDLNLDLNGYTLSSTRSLVFDGYDVNIYNGDLSFEMQGSGIASIYVRKGSTFTLNDVEMKESVGIAFAVYNAKLDIEDSKIEAAVYTISTNAGSEENYPNDITVKDSILSTINGNNFDNTAILMNVPGKLVIENSELLGDRQGIICRGGDTTITNSKVVLTGEWSLENEDGFVGNATWLDGNKVPSATIVLGNNNTSAYQYAANLTLNNTEVICKALMTSNATNIYAKGNVSDPEGEFIGATLTINNKDLALTDLMMANIIESINEGSVKLNTLISNRETLDAVMLYVKMLTAEIPDEYKDQAIPGIIQALNLQLTQDIFFMEEEMTGAKFYEYVQASLMLDQLGSKYGFGCGALMVKVENDIEFSTAYYYNYGSVKLMANIDLAVGSEEIKESILSDIESGIIITNGFDLNISVDESIGGGQYPGGGSQEGQNPGEGVQGVSVVVNANYGEDLNDALNEIRAEAYNKLNNTSETGKDAQRYSLYELKNLRGVELEKYYVKFARITGLQEIYSINFESTQLDKNNIKISIGNNVFIEDVPFKFDNSTGELYIASVILATETKTSEGITINGFDGTNVVSRYEKFDNKITNLEVNPTTNVNEISGENNEFILSGSSSTNYITFDYVGNQNTNNSLFAVTKKIYIDKSTQDQKISYGFSTTDAKTKEGKYTLGLYPISYGIDLEDSSIANEWNNTMLDYTAYIQGVGVIDVLINFEIPVY